MPSEADKTDWLELNAALRACLRARTCAKRAENPTATTHIQCGAIAALASSGIKESEPEDSRPVLYAKASASKLMSANATDARAYSVDTLGSRRNRATPAPTAPKQTTATY